MAKVWRFPFGFLRTDGAGILIAMAMMLPIVLGFAAVAVDTWLWRAASSDMQSAANAAALAGAIELARPGSDRAAVIAAARRDAAISGFDKAADVDVAIAANDTLVSVTIRHPAPRFLTEVAIGGPADLTTKAAAIKQAPGVMPHLIQYSIFRAQDASPGAAANAQGE